jgi:hypothetical protein
MGVRSTTRHNYATALYVYANYDPPSGTDTLVVGCNPVAELVAASLTGVGHGDIDVTHLESLAGFKEMLPGWGEGGEFQFKFNYVDAVWNLLNNLTPDLPNDTAPAYGRQRIALRDAGGSELTARVKFSAPTKEGGEDGHDIMNVTCKVMEGRPEITLAD